MGSYPPGSALVFGTHKLPGHHSTESKWDTGWEIMAGKSSNIELRTGGFSNQLKTRREIQWEFQDPKMEVC